MNSQPLQLWGGLECSVVKVGGVWRDQVVETGHQDRIGDLALVAGLGVRTVRYPVLWERCGVRAPGWEWHDRRLEALDGLGITPIVGLIHHGTGPLAGGMLDRGFARGLAAHAGRVAERYPFVARWTPVNEPLTTARFACLYGFWHPHRRSEGAFLRAVVAQCQAALLAMRAVRRSVPRATFMHTEDMCRVFSTRPLAAQAAYENERRWLSLDLLCGKLGRSHPWWGRLLAAGAAEAVLDELATGEAAPDVIGVNHYVTSDRFLDHRLANYPASLHGGNGRTVYADTEAARVSLPPGARGWPARLREVWARFGVPLVLSEVHLGCDDEVEQVRWLMQAWNAAQTLRTEGAAVEAVTAWALMGLNDWSSMLVQQRQHYEPGAFDARYDPPRPMLLSHAIRGLAQDGRFSHPGLQAPGWWQALERPAAAVRVPA